MRQPLTIITACFNRPRKLQRLWESFRRWYPDYYLCVADNSPEPLDLQFLAADPKAKVVRCEEVGNISAARSRALSEVRTPYVGVMDDDEWFTDTTLTTLYNQCANGRAEVCAGAVGDVVFAGHMRLENGGLRILPLLNRARPQYVDTCQNYYVARTDTLLRLQPWEPEFAIIGEHMASLLKMKQAGLRIWHDPGCVVQHESGGDRGREDEYRHWRHRSRCHDQVMQRHHLEWMVYANNRKIVRGEDEWKHFANPTAYLILTTGRTGSSALAQCLHTMGIPMGDQLGRPPWDREELNPDGYFEDLSLIRQNARLSNHFDLEEAAEEIRDHAQRMLVHHSAFGCKFPGSARSLFLVCKALRSAGVKTLRFIWSHRDLEDSVQSLLRTGWQTDEAKAREHLQDRQDHIEAFLKKQPPTDQLVVRYQRLRENPARQCQRLAQFCGLGPNDPNVQAAAQTVRPIAS